VWAVKAASWVRIPPSPLNERPKVRATEGLEGRSSPRHSRPERDFSGKIKSSKQKCLGGRKVIVYRLRGNGYDPEHDAKIAKDTSEVVGNHGEWSVGNTGAGPGAYYAFAKRSPGCKIGFSIPLQL
jgi:hypothetical protein